MAFVVQVGIFLAVYVLAGIAWRLWFHRLCQVPGPRLAAITGWYEFYQDVILDGNYVKEYPKLHEKYGPVVRIAPNHVHVKDMTYYQEVYGNGTKYLKDPGFYETFGVKHSLLMFTNPAEHKERYDIIKSIFAKQKIEKLAPFVSEIVEKGLRRAQESLQKGTPWDIQQAYRCVTVDTITRVLFNKSMNLIESDDATPPFLESMDTFSDRVQTMKHLPVLNRIALKLPLSWANIVAKGYVQFRLDCDNWIQEVADRHELGVYCAEDGRHTIFDLLLRPNVAKGYKVPTHESLVDEAFIFCFAGTDTTSYALSCSTYYLLTHADKLKRLREELDTVPRNTKGMLEFQNVRNLPYLTAVIKESLRVSTPIPGNLPRVVPKGGAYVGGTFIPPKSIVSVCPRLIHYNAEIYKDPRSFIPERWLGPEAGALEKWHVPFSKGPRSCIGFNIAYLELYTCLSNFFGLMDMELYNTDTETMKWRDYGTCRNADHVKVVVKNVK
ncbi:cytochrome P450 [Cryphonectria parasitica EP155]|uniref:Cytochrome P450 n=1 Tax=Cryphonectria parasitica (strain ATCC 38755 / EP155) TaxID=660469 RepID=A0A9P5CJG3_CRYP1|nr:cytochrome P450 [Cryphonectria parasitica EP155]KAF3761239.1 cytochrome P450 [Cryphonectria parasitica EP155]